MGHWANYVGHRHVPQIVKVDEIDEWIVSYDGKKRSYSSEDVAQRSAEYFRKQGYMEVTISHKRIPIMGEILP